MFLPPPSHFPQGPILDFRAPCNYFIIFGFEGQPTTARLLLLSTRTYFFDSTIGLSIEAVFSFLEGL
jgi:hypothetical protein